MKGYAFELSEGITPQAAGNLEKAIGFLKEKILNEWCHV